MASLKIYNGTEWVTMPSVGSASFQIDQSGGTSDTYGDLAGTINSTNTTFTVSTTAYVSGSLKVYLNGQLQTQGSSEDWVETTPDSGIFDFITAPETGDEITVTYQSVLSTIGNADLLDGQHGNYYTDIVNDTTPQLGGDLDVNGSNISNSVEDDDILVGINDGGTDRTAIQVHGDSGIVSMPRQSYVRAERNTTQTIATETHTTVVFDSEIEDTLGEYNTSTGVFTATEAGVYQVSSIVQWNVGNTGAYMLAIWVNGSREINAYKAMGFTSSRWGTSVHGAIKLTAGQYIEIKAWQNTGVNQIIDNSNPPINVLTITKVS